ncbi:sugar transferase [Aetokthonos hydrillicola Thurmond2011]|jgi:lipopolysaccharide/colanic/teichoic acid biosynthesis glycosyltransferase|uniref:Sugar transferase n=1 Tax=Aetokthonos hydrillicola Thurmond2011 TaxID=2712845 RepID=A0AAP5IGW9_9CYAN|nr:heterocyst development glycosyltransferase HepC [Aetokthonos hydrillicola]MBW4589648.1 sugar transferase [Aetokthonos hydrillicola CCALA 1050]MDR9899145.1 sugar transferase [Aetokthonos hydrillicola Thurmond2011]
MTTSLIPASKSNTSYYTSAQEAQDNHAPYCTLQWRCGQLLVKSPRNEQQPYLAALDTEESLTKCLEHSRINLVRIDPKLGEAKILLWANACLQAKKPIFLNIPPAHKPPTSGGSLSLWVKKAINWSLGLVFLVVLSPIMFGLGLMLQRQSPGSVFTREWHIGKRGKLFRVIKFSTTTVAKESLIQDDEQNTSSLGLWIRRYGLDNLPMLLNVLSGEMSLTGFRSISLTEAVRLSHEQQRQLNQKPGMLSSWEVEPETNVLHLDGQTL